MTLFTLIPGLKGYEHVAAAGLAASLLLYGAYAAREGLRAQTSPLPDGRGSVLNLFGLVIEWVRSMAHDIIGHDADRYVPFLCALFFYILTCNLMGFIPGVAPPTSNITTNWACAITVFVMYNYWGFRAHGVGYLKHFAGPVLWLAWLMVPIELVSHLVRPLTLSVRLYGNMMGDHTALDSFLEIAPAALPMLIMILGLLVALIQALIFMILSAIYIALAVAEGH